MATLTEHRAALAEALGALPYVPEAIDPPAIVIEPGDPYLDFEDGTFDADDVTINMDVFVLVAETSNQDQALQLDKALTSTVALLVANDWGIDSISKPGPWETADWQAYGVQIKTSASLSVTFVTGLVGLDDDGTPVLLDAQPDLLDARPTDADTDGVPYVTGA